MKFNQMKSIAIQTTKQILNDQVQGTYNARELHSLLKSKQQFANWIKARIKKYNFIEGYDFIVNNFVNNKQGHFFKSFKNSIKDFRSLMCSFIKNQHKNTPLKHTPKTMNDNGAIFIISSQAGN